MGLELVKAVLLGFDPAKPLHLLAYLSELTFNFGFLRGRLIEPIKTLLIAAEVSRNVHIHL